MPRLAFGSFVLDPSRGILLQGGLPVAVSSRGLALLQALVKAQGQVVTRSELIEVAWPGSIVEESNLTVQIAQLRRHLGESEQWITTVPRIGYRFLGEVRTHHESGELADTLLIGAPIAEAKRSIAVLPFANLSSDPEQEYFVDGLAEDLIADLSKIPGLLVIARSSSFVFKGQPAEIGIVANRLKVRYIIEGSVRRAAERVRINVQLIDATKNSPMWADRFDRDLADVFSLQDEVVGRIVKVLSGAIPAANLPSPQRPTNLKAYDLFARARVLAIQSRVGNHSARPLLAESIAIEPDFAAAHAWLAMTHHFGWLYWQEPVDPHRSHARDSAERAVALDAENADARWILGYVRAYDGKLAEAVTEFETALRINPSHADAWALFTDVRVLEGRPFEAVECAQQAFRLNPYPPGIYYWVLAWAQYAAGQYEASVETLLHETARGTGAQRHLAASLAKLGRFDEAKREADEYLSVEQHFRVGEWASTQPFQRSIDRQHFIDGYLEAGLPW